MTIDPRVQQLIDEGVTIHAPATVWLDNDVDVARISRDGVEIFPGCRIRGAKTVISAGCELGAEGPVTLVDCQLGPKVKLKGGYAEQAVFLEGAHLGLGHHVRGGTILEEEAGGAHTVGLKQTILFPFVTLGSLINFCDAFMAGGTSRSDHSEVGSSYIHFNFTPAQDKTTASLFGDVPRGVTLRERPIFLGGQGGTVGPVRVGYGTVVGAGSVIRADIETEGQLVVVAPPADLTKPFTPERYKRIAAITEHNLLYLSQLTALEQWYRHARAPFFAAQELGGLVLEGALAALASARTERVSRLEKVRKKLDPGNAEHARVIAELPGMIAATAEADAPDEAVISVLTQAAQAGTLYLQAIQGLDEATTSAATAWLQGIIDVAKARYDWLSPAV